MDASMVCHTGEKDGANSRAKQVNRHVVPALPLRPVQRRPALDKARDAVSVENKSEYGGQATPDPDQAIKVQFGEVEEEHMHTVYCSPASFGNNTSLVDVAPSSLQSGTFALAQRGISNSEKSLLDASNNNNNDTSTLAPHHHISNPPQTVLLILLILLILDNNHFRHLLLNYQQKRASHFLPHSTSPFSISRIATLTAPNQLFTPNP
jgi:hypothetical protein